MLGFLSHGFSLLLLLIFSDLVDHAIGHQDGKLDDMIREGHISEIDESLYFTTLLINDYVERIAIALQLQSRVNHYDALVQLERT